MYRTKRRPKDSQRSRGDQALAADRAKLWTERAISARKAGLTVNANRCEDKARDWSSRARQLERLQEET
ncbi:MAG TPA: hypothetical protein VJS12_04730 [Steroidobacteraceae bacterium]|nr:hypothetical protein [Steroidobacteraceae bacterium]